MFDLGLEAITRYQEIAYYGRVWLLEFRDYSNCLVLEDPADSPAENYILEPIE